MKLRHKILAGLAALSLCAGLAIAQVPGLFIASPTGLEQINVLVPSPSTGTSNVVTNPQIQTVTINQIRNSEGYVTAAAGTTVTTTMAPTASVAIATGVITTWNVVLPGPNPPDGQIGKVTCPGGAVTTVAVTAPAVPASQTVVGAAFTSCSATTPTDAAWHYSLSANTWYRTE